jgi:hypothetical protein
MRHLYRARSAASVFALKKKSASKSTLGARGSQRSRVTASASKIAQIGPPPLWPSPIPASAALMKLLGAYLTFLTFR